MYANTELAAQGWSKVYEIYPATEDVLRLAVINDTIYLKSHCACHNGEECSFISKIDTAGNLLDLLELYKAGRGIQLGAYADIIKINDKLVTTGDDSWDNDTLNLQTQHLDKFDSNLNNFETFQIPVVDGLVQFGGNLLYFNNENLIITRALKFNPKLSNKYVRVINAINGENEIIWSYDYQNLNNLTLRDNGEIIKNSDTSFVVSMRVGWANIHYFSMNTKGKLLWKYTEINNVDGLITPSTFKPMIAPSEASDIVRAWYYDGKSSSEANLQTEVSRISNKGDLKWQCKFPATSNLDTIQKSGKRVWQLIKTQNGDYVGVGEAVYFHYNKDWSTKFIYTVGYAFRVGDDGSMKWERYMYDKSRQKYGLQYFYSVAEGDDGSLYFAGNIADSIPNVPGSSLNDNIWLVKTGPDGCLTPGCDELVSVSTKKVLNRHPDILRVYPNPGSSELNISWGDVPSMPQRVDLRSISGQLVRSLPVDGYAAGASISVPDLQPGLYLLSLHGRDWQSLPQKWVKVEW